MVDWSSPDEIAKDAAAFSKLIHVVIGFYLWEFIISLDFEWDVFMGKKKFKWPLIFYFLGRYCLLGALIGIVVALNVTTEVNCQALYTFNQALGNMAIGFASINLSIRTIAIWARDYYVVVPITLLILGHWSLLLYGIAIKSYWDPTEMTCIIESVNTHTEVAIFMYTVCFDFIVMILMGYKLMNVNSRKSKVANLIFVDGLSYFAIAFSVNLVVAIFSILNLNSAMNVITDVPSVAISTVAACRAVRRLTNFGSSGHPQVSGRSTTIAFGTSSSSQPRKLNNLFTKQNQVHVHMDTFSDTMPADKSTIELDIRGRPDADLVEDVEAQRNDFKPISY